MQTVKLVVFACIALHNFSREDPEGADDEDDEDDVKGEEGEEEDEEEPDEADEEDEAAEGGGLAAPAAAAAAGAPIPAYRLRQQAAAWRNEIQQALFEEYTSA